MVDSLEVFLAATAGFCFGVRRALQRAEQAMADKNGPCFTLGPIIHNPQAVERLARQGLSAVDNLDELQSGTVILRSHGVPPGLLDEAGRRGLKVIDTTCPFVQKAQRAAQELHRNGYQVVVVGDREHPEIVGLVGWAENQAWVARDPDEASLFPYAGKIGVIAQTTLPQGTFRQVLDILKTKTDELVVHNTICHATQERQKEAVTLAQSVDVMLVVGGRNSANTRHLAQLCAETGTPAYHIEHADEVHPRWFDHKERIGLTAGASTPDWIIEEVVNKMEELNQAEAMGNEETRKEEPAPASEAAETAVTVPEAEVSKEGVSPVEVKEADETPIEDKNAVEIHFAESMKDLRKGEIVSGTVVQVTNNEVLVDVGGKSEGIIPLVELANRPVSDPFDIVKPGDIIEVQVLRVEDEEGHPVLSKRRADRRRAWETMENTFKNQDEIQAQVVDVVKGGLLVDIGVNGFVPASLVERGYVENLDNYRGKTLRLRVIELDRNKNKVVLSQKAILEEEYDKQRKETWENLQTGQICHGTVRRLTNFGAFVDIGGVDGLLHVSEISWGRVDHPKSVLNEGQEIDVKVLGIDREEGKVSLGLKQLLPNPWHVAAEKYPPGAIIQGKVLRIAPFGAFVEVEPGVEGLVHISQLADRHVVKTEDIVSVGQVIPVKVLSVDQEAQRMSLSLREAGGEKRREPEDIGEAPEEKEPSVKLGDLFGDLFEGKENG